MKKEIDMQTGTLKELDVKAGDVVECVGIMDGNAGLGEVMTINSDGDACKAGFGLFDPIYDERYNRTYRIISRANTTPTTWAEMTDAEKGAILLAVHNGSDIEAIDPADEWDTWETVGAYSFGERIAYRIRQTPSWLPLVVGGKYATYTGDRECIAVIDGKAWLTSGGDTAAYTWDANTGATLSLFGHTDYNITGLAK